MSKKELDRLGDRLRDAAVPSEEDLRLLEAVRPHYLAALGMVRAVLADELGLAVTHREKNRDTIIEKLKRERDMRLSRVQDIVGARIVRDMTLPEQDALVAGVVARFPEHRLVDRREKPSHGYRAVHVVARVDGIPVEVQVRTALQHGWAQAMERLGDNWGRSVRYGGEPERAEQLHAILPGAAERSRLKWVALLKDTSPLIAIHEASTTPVVTIVEVKDADRPYRLEEVLDSFLAARL